MTTGFEVGLENLSPGEFLSRLNHTSLGVCVGGCFLARHLHSLPRKMWELPPSFEDQNIENCLSEKIQVRF